MTSVGQVSKAEADAAEKEAKAVKSRMAELKRKQQAGELTDEEKAELRCECSRLPLMNLIADDDLENSQTRSFGVNAASRTPLLSLMITDGDGLL